uniref:Ferritin n=1 Tax=Caenorhabditis japonica TaxID=281687 RepID=A0A8R1DS85_CAEJA
MSLARQNYHEEVEAAVNKQINIELYASYVYLSMSSHFDRDDVALPNIAKFFAHQSEEERGHALELMRIQNVRGGRVVLQDIQRPEKDEWGTVLEAFEAALSLEKFNNESLLKLHGVADKKNDPQLTNFLEGQYLDEQVRSINEFARHVASIKRAGPGLGEYLYDKEQFD